MYVRLKPSDYPDDWLALSRYIRLERAFEQCECCGECGLHRTHPGPRRCVERDRNAALWARGMVILTTAHLCGEDCPDVPQGKRVCGNPAHLKALCNRCHLRLDGPHHRRVQAENRRHTALQHGQLSFLDIPTGEE